MNPTEGDTGVPEDAIVTWQWYRVKADGEDAIDGATKASYTVVADDIGCRLKAVATASSSDPKYEGKAEGTSEEVLDLSITVTAMAADDKIKLVPRTALNTPQGAVEPEELTPVDLGVTPAELQENISVAPQEFDFRPFTLDDMNADMSYVNQSGKITGNLNGFLPTNYEKWIDYWAVSDTTLYQDAKGNFIALNVDLPEGTVGRIVVCRPSSDSDNANEYYYICTIQEDGNVVVPIPPTGTSSTNTSVLQTDFSLRIEFRFSQDLQTESPAHCGTYICTFDLKDMKLNKVESPS